MSVVLDKSAVQRIYRDATGALTRKHRFDMAWFGERVESDALVVGYRSGAVSELSNKTPVRPGLGLGGLVYATNRVQKVDNYVGSSEITHEYDERIEAESLKSVIGAPVWAEGSFFGVVMGGSRDGALGGRAATLLDSVARSMSEALMAAILRERLAVLQNAARETAAHLRDLEARAGAPFGGIRDREREVLKFVALGHTNREIAQALQLSECTVKSYLRNVMQRLGARNRTEAIACARNAGLL